MLRFFPDRSALSRAGTLLLIFHSAYSFLFFFPVAFLSLSVPSALLIIQLYLAPATAAAVHATVGWAVL